MQVGMTIEDLLTEVKRQNGVKKDYVASTQNDFRIVPMTEFPAGVAAVLQKGQGGESPTDEPLERLQITEHAHRQIASRLGIPWKFYARLLQDHKDMVIDNVNKLFEREPGTRLLRTLDGKLRAFLSNRYRRLDNAEVLENVLPPIVTGEVETAMLSSNVTDSKMYVKILFTDHDLAQNVGVIKGKQDIVRPGFILSNSEVGAGTLSIRGFFYRDFCYNGCVFGKTDAFEFRRSHLGGALVGGDGFEILSEKSQQKEDEAIMSQVTDIMHAIASPEFVAKMGDRLRAINAADNQIENPVPAIEVIQKEFGLRQEEADTALANLLADGNLTQWGAVNAITKLANDEPDYDRVCELEEIGSKVIDLNRSQWLRIATAEREAVAA